MLLSVRERLLIQSIIPNEGDFITLKIIRKLKDDLSFSEEEIKQYQFINNNDLITWDNSGEQNKEIPIGEKANDIIVSALVKLNEQKKLKMEHMDLYEKFVK
jgi:hypothetical protein